MKVLVAIALLAACGNKDAPVGPGSSGSAARGSNIQPKQKDSDPSAAVVQRAFAGNKPAFPVLSKDGNQTAVEIVTLVGMTQATTYSVAFIGVGADAWSGGAEGEQVTLVDGKLVALLLDSPEVSTYDVDGIAKAAAGIKERIAGFTPFEGSIDALGIGDTIAAGPFKLRVTEETSGALTVNLTGAMAITDKIDPLPMARVGDIDCVALPHAKHAWYDTARQRLLLEVSWNAGPDQCDAPDERFRLYGK